MQLMTFKLLNNDGYVGIRLWRLQEAADPPVRAFPYEHAFRNLALASRSWPGEDANFSAVRAQRSSISSRRTA
jgi:hypothetical protein